jgi:hypothetical protein
MQESVWIEEMLLVQFCFVFTCSLLFSVLFVYFVSLY